jgi:nucleoside-diphosphate-sugar epimerase
VANAFAEHKTGGNFVFISAAKTIAPMFLKYSEMKQEAEDFLLKEENKEKMNVVILRPGLVWHGSQRQWSFPLKLATDIGYTINRDIIKTLPNNEKVQGLFPQSASINLSRLSDCAVQGSLGTLQKFELKNQNIWSNEEMNEN